nr:hypothetical protein [Kibdelosporangium sp. MJ126-NF4]CEL20905.1 hypothetical protein [Kibdelosporangium sp. MJ126-NF4]CTQ98290.1 hypothetical protein [Kibdelosporangium sp. MJ126-NF4]
MTDGELVRRYEELRRAAAAVIERTEADATPVFPIHQQKLDALAEALNGTVRPDAATREILDPDRHLLSLRDYQVGVAGGAPFPFANRAQGIRENMAVDDATEERTGEWPDDFAPALTELKAMTVATLLQELAARVAATGDSGGQELAAVARELADELLAPTFVGAQR